MGFNDEIRQFSEELPEKKKQASTEEATKMSMILPLFTILGYDVFNPSEFCPEYTADIGIKTGEKVDYAILGEGEPAILIECKSWKNSLDDKFASQLFRYFGATSAKFGILTNGIEYRFFTDLEEMNKMDTDPFLVIDMLNLKDSTINELKKFQKDTFDRETIFSSAEELKYDILIKEWLSTEFTSPSEEFVKFVLLANNYPGQKTQRVIDKFTPLIKKTISTYINDIVNDKISSALTEEPEPEEEEKSAATASKIVTTEEEIESFYIIRGMLCGVVPVEDIAYRDTVNYFGILYQNNNRKTICRLNLDAKKKLLSIQNENKTYDSYYIDSLNDLYKYKQQLINVVNRYL